MKTKTYNVYTFEELPEDAQKKALDNWRCSDSEYSFSEEWRKSLEAFQEYFPVKVTDWSIGLYTHSFIDWHFTGEDEHAQFTGKRLAKHLWNEYQHALFQGKYYGKLVDHEKDGTKIEKSKEHPAGLRHVKRYSKVIKEPRMLTGYCSDLELTNALHKALDGSHTGTFEELLSDCIDQFKSAWVADMEYQDSDEYIKETFEANEYEFTLDGRID